MYKDQSFSDLSELEMELELEMDDEFEQDGEVNDEFEGLDEFESLNDEFEHDEELDDEFEGGENEYLTSDNFLADEREGSDYGQRFFELARQEFESETEREQVVNNLMNEMGEEFFFGSIKKGWQKLKKKGLGQLLQKGLTLAAGRFPQLKVLQGLTDLAKGNLKGLLKNVAMSALAAHPAGAGAMAAMKALGFEANRSSEENQEAWENYVTAARESYEYLAESLNANADNPLEASRLALGAFKQGVQKAINNKVTSRQLFSPGRRGHLGGRRRVRVINVRAGEKVIVKVQTGGKALIKSV